VNSAIGCLDQDLSGNRRFFVIERKIKKDFPLLSSKSCAVGYGGPGGMRAKSGCVSGQTSECSSLMVQATPASLLFVATMLTLNLNQSGMPICRR
jgi:hypothetical protein